MITSPKTRDNEKISLMEFENVDVVKSENQDPDFHTEENKLHLLTQSDLNDFIRCLDLSKEKSEKLASRFKQWNLLQPDTKSNYVSQTTIRFAFIFLFKEQFPFL